MPLNDIINGAIEKLTQRIEELKTQIGELKNKTSELKSDLDNRYSKNDGNL